jgi:PAS domain S-box-containing protein
MHPFRPATTDDESTRTPASRHGTLVARWFSLKTRTIGFVLLTCLILVGLDAVHMWDDRFRAIEKAQDETANLARSLAQNADDTIEAADASIVGLVERLEQRDGASPEDLQQFRKIMAVRTASHPTLADLIICDDAGNRLASASPASPLDRCVADREYVQHHRTHASHEPHLGPPMRGGTPGAWIVPVSRRFDHPDGSFAGVVIAAVDMAHFQNLYGTFEIGREGTILLALDDGTLLVRRPFVAAKIGSSMLSAPLFHDYLPRHATGIGTAEIEAPTGPVTRLVSYRRSDHYPLVVAATLAKDEVLADWRAEAWKHLIGAIVLVGTIGFFGLRLAAQIEKRQQAEKALRAEAEQLRVSEARLRESRQHLNRAQELAESGSFEHDIRTGQVTWSDNLYKIFGVDRTSFAVSRVSELVHPVDRARFDRSYRDHALGIATTAAEFRVIRPDGGCRTIIDECAARRDEHGADGILLGTVRDVTSAKAAEGRLRMLETQLHHSQKLEALGTLARGIAHDLNNALVPTIMMTEIVMKKHAEGSRERANLALALAGAMRAKDLVRRFLAFARKEKTEKHELDLATLVKEAMTTARASLPATIELVTVAESTPAIFGDSGQLCQAIGNLVTNAAHAIGDAPGKITATLRSADSGSQIELTVTDTGSGMDETTKQRIFDPFFTTKAVNEGAGLGLSIVHGIVVAHAGTIAVTSQLGRGSAFSITLPVAGQRQDDDAQAAPAAA